jgi:hypothetical protein
VLQGLGQWPEAEILFRRALKLAEKTWGVDHDYLATPLEELADVLQVMNRATEAESLLRRAVEIKEKRFGRKDPGFGHSVGKLARLLQALHRLQEAEPLMRQRVEILLGYGWIPPATEHPNLREAVTEYRDLLAQMGRGQDEVHTQLNAVGAPFGRQFNR